MSHVQRRTVQQQEGGFLPEAELERHTAKDLRKRDRLSRTSCTADPRHLPRVTDLRGSTTTPCSGPLAAGLFCERTYVQSFGATHTPCRSRN